MGETWTEQVSCWGQEASPLQHGVGPPGGLLTASVSALDRGQEVGRARGRWEELEKASTCLEVGPPQGRVGPLLDVPALLALVRGKGESRRKPGEEASRLRSVGAGEMPAPDGSTPSDSEALVTVLMHPSFYLSTRLPSRCSQSVGVGDKVTW